MNRVDRSRAYIESGMSVIGDRPGEARPPAPSVDVDDSAFVPAGLKAWAGRFTNGIAVQGLVDDEGQTYISVVFGRQAVTFEVPRDRAVDAFDHPFSYPACTVRL